MDRLASDDGANPALLLPLEALKLGSRAYVALRDSHGCKTVRDVTQLTAHRIYMSPNFGMVSLRQVREHLKTFGLALADE